MLFSRYRRRPEESTDLCILHFVFTLYDDRLGPLGGHKVHKMVKFRPRGMVDKREMEQAQLFETADERGCTPMFGAAHRRGSASIGGCLPPPAARGFPCNRNFNPTTSLLAPLGVAGRRPQ